MSAYSLSQLSDQVLLDQLAALVATDRQTTAALLAHIAEVDARKLYLPAACSAMHVYCVQVLHLSDDAAYKRITAARAARRFPAILAAVADGRLTLDAVSRLAPRLTDANAADLLAAAAYRTRAGIELLLAERFPRPDVPASLEPLPSPAPGLAPARAVPDPATVTRTEPLSPRRFALRLTIEQATHDKLERAQALLRHRVPSGDLSQVVDRALDSLLAALERERFAATDRPRAGKARPADADPRYVPREIVRAVHARDGERCSFVSASGDRCAERGFLEIDHVDPVARGGQPTFDRTRLLCSGHNQYEAERILGAGFMQRRRDRARAVAAVARAGSPGPARAHGEADRPSMVGPVDASATGPSHGEADGPSMVGQVDASATGPARAHGEADGPSTVGQVDASATGPARAHGEAVGPSTVGQVDASATGPARAHGEADGPSMVGQVDASATGPARAHGEAVGPSTVGQVDASATGPSHGEADGPSMVGQVDASATGPARAHGEADCPSTVGQVDASATGPARAHGEADGPSTVGQVDASATGPARAHGEAVGPSTVGQVDASATGPARAHGEADGPSMVGQVDASATGPARAHGEAVGPSTVGQVDASATGPSHGEADGPSMVGQVDASATGPARAHGEADCPSTVGQVDASATGPARAHGEEPDRPVAAPARAADPERDDAAAREMEADVLSGLRGLGFRAADARHAVARSAPAAAATLEERLRAALAVLRTTCATRIADAEPAPGDGLDPWAARLRRPSADRLRCAPPYSRSSSRPIIGRSLGA